MIKIIATRFHIVSH